MPRLYEKNGRGGVKVDWCITDPPYGINAGGVGRKNYKENNGGVAERRDYEVKEWDNTRITKEYFDIIKAFMNLGFVMWQNLYL